MSIEANDTPRSVQEPDEGNTILQPQGGTGDAGRGGLDADGTPARAETDGDQGFSPPDEPIMVFCLHCGKEYLSSEMVPPDGKRTEVMTDGIWWCGTPGCNAGGFGLDIFPVDPQWKDPKGLLHIHVGSDDENEDDEDEWDEDDDDDEL